MSLLSRRPVIPLLAAAVAGLVASALPGGGATTARAANDALITGTLEIEVRGTGAAPFGIASGITTGVGVGYNLARLQNLELPTEVDGLAGSERYKARARFWLRADGADRWVLDELTVRYDFHDSTTINYDAQASIVDALGDSGSATWREGGWSGAEVDLGQPSIVFERSDGDIWTFSAEIFHPVQATGTSSWTSPLGEISLSATKGVYDFRGRDFMGNPLPIALPPLDHSGGWSWSAKFEEPWDGNGDFVAFDAFTVLTGADAYEILQLQPMSPVLYKVDADALPGSVFEVKAAVEGPAPRPLKWLFTLYEISCEKGMHLNKSLAARAMDCRASGSYDMELYAAPGFEAPVKWDGGETWTIETSGEKVDVEVLVLADDHGGWARLRADVWIDGEWVPVRVDGSDKDYITLPLDEAGGVENHIADGWEAQWGLAGVDPKLDDETDPAGATAGDGLSVYEEYRGFGTLEDGHRRTSPKRKTLLVQADDSLLAGVRLFQKASGLEVLPIRADGHTGPDDRVANFNGGFAHRVDQHAVLVRHATEDEERPCRDGEKQTETGCGTLSPTAAGMTLGDLSTPPGGTTTVLVSRTASGPDETTAHELGHAVGIVHHGNLDFRKAWIERGGYTACAMNADDGSYIDYTCEPPEGARTAYIAVPKGEHSGQLACLMVYTSADGYTATGALQDVTRSADGRLEPFPFAPRRDHLCTKKAPSASNPVGGAARGQCHGQIKISDEHP